MGVGYNKIFLIGRLTADPTVKSIKQTTETLCNATLAVNRFDNKEADFLDLVAYGKQSEVLGQYCHKGSLVHISGRLQNRNYEDRSGKKVYVTEVVVQEVCLLESKSKAEAPKAEPQKSQRTVDIPKTQEAERPAYHGHADDDGDIPFAP